MREDVEEILNENRENKSLRLECGDNVEFLNESCEECVPLDKSLSICPEEKFYHIIQFIVVKC
jgi:hypothetical protein